MNDLSAFFPLGTPETEREQRPAHRRSIEHVLMSDAIGRARPLIGSKRGAEIQQVMLDELSPVGSRVKSVEGLRVLDIDVIDPRTNHTQSPQLPSHFMRDDVVGIILTAPVEHKRT